MKPKLTALEKELLQACKQVVSAWESVQSEDREYAPPAIQSAIVLIQSVVNKVTEKNSAPTETGSRV